MTARVESRIAAVEARMPLLGASFVLIAAGLLLGGIGLGRIDLDSRITFMSFGAFVYVLGLFLLVFVREKTLGLLELRLGAWFLVYGSLVFGLATVSITTRQLGSGAIVDKASIPAALIIAAFAFTAWAIGYAGGGAAIVRRFGERTFGLVADRRSEVVRGPLSSSEYLRSAWALTSSQPSSSAAMATSATRPSMLSTRLPGTSNLSWSCRILSPPPSSVSPCGSS